MSDPRKVLQAIANQARRGSSAASKVEDIYHPPGSPEREENLARFLSGSRMRDDAGDPLRLYHITKGDFNEFIPGGSIHPGDWESGPATWLSPYPDKQPAAHQVGGYRGDDGERVFRSGTNVMPVHAAIKNPLIIDDATSYDWARKVFADDSAEFPQLLSPQTRARLIEDGYDGIVYAGPSSTRSADAFYGSNAIGSHPEREEEIISLFPNTLKSATGNRGTFDPNDVDINKAEGGPVNTPTEGEGGLYAAPNSTFDTPPPYEWGYRPGGAHADGGLVEMKVGGFFKRLARSVAGKPDTVKLPDVGNVPAQPLAELEDISQRFATRHGNQYPIESYSPLDEERARRIAQEYDSMQHNPFDPATKRSYEALVDETMDQYRALKDTGVDFSFLKPGEADPYARNPGLGYLDLINNGRLKMFPTSAGHGTLNEVTNNPLLKRVGRVGDLEDATANDAFRIVHDMLGHYGPGNPFFRSKGEERAWRAHGRAYSPDALPAATSELRGQNSWVNYGPHGESNKTASGADTIYADQKVGLMPPWTWLEKADGGPVEMALGGTTPVSTGGQYQPRESEGPGFFRNQNNYENSSAGGINFVKKFVQNLSPAEREAQRLVSEATRKTGKEALVFGRGENPNDLAKLTQGTYENVSIPGNYAQYALQSADPFFTFHTHGTNTLSPSAADLRIWGATQPGTIGLPYQSMFINASPQDSLLRIGVPGKWMDSDAQRLVQEVLNLKNKNEDLVANHGFMDPRMREFWKGNKLPDLAHLLHAESDQMPGVKSYLDKKEPGAAQGVTMRDLYAGNFLQRIAEAGIPVDVSAEHKIAGTPYLARDVWPEFAAHVQKYALPKAEGGPVEMSTGGQYDAPSGGGYIRNNLEDMYAGDPTQAIRGGVRTRLARQHQMDTPKGKAAPPDPRIQTVRDPERMVYPGIYKDPDVIAEEASRRLMRDYGKDGPMYRLFGHTRSSLDELSQGRDLEGMRPWPLRQAYTPPGGSTGASVSEQVLTPRNATRLLDIHGEAMKYPGLRETRSWYEMLPLYQRMDELGIPIDEQRLFNQRTGIFSAAASPVSEINRGTLAHHLAQQGRVEDFIKYGGVAEKNRASVLGFPEDIMDMKSHAYHGTAQAPTLAEIEMSGGYWPKEHKVGTYIGATDPVFPNYTRPIADSHIARGVGYADVRPGKLANVKANLSNPEYTDFYPWWENKIAGQTGLRPRDEQAFMWNVLGPQTGVRYIGPSKLELMSNQMMKASKRLGVAPDVARDMVLRGEAGAYKEGGTVEDEYHPIWQQSFSDGGQPEEEPRGFFAPQYSPKQRAEQERRRAAERLAQEDVEIKRDLGGHYRDMATQIPRGMASVLELLGLPGDVLNLRADYLDSVAPGSSPMRIPHWGTSEGISKGLDSVFPETTSRYGGETGRALGEMSLNMLGLGAANKARGLARGFSEVGNGANLAATLFGGPASGETAPEEEWRAPPRLPRGYEQFVDENADDWQRYNPTTPTMAHGGPVGYAGGGHAKDTGNTFDFLGPFGAGLNIIADGAGAIFNGEDFELDKALGYLGEIGGGLVAPGVGGPLGRGAGTAAAHLIEPGEGGDIGQDALRAGYGALRGGAGMFFAHGGSTGFLPQGDEEDPNDLTRFLSPQVNPSKQPGPMDWAGAGGVPGAISPPLNANNGQVARDAAERQRLMQMAEGASRQALQGQGSKGGGGGGGMGDLTQIASMAMKFLPMMMAAEGGPVPNQDGEQPWMYGDGALMARGGYLRGCGGMNG